MVAGETLGRMKAADSLKSAILRYKDETENRRGTGHPEAKSRRFAKSAILRYKGTGVIRQAEAGRSGGCLSMIG